MSESDWTTISNLCAPCALPDMHRLKWDHAWLIKTEPHIRHRLLSFSCLMSREPRPLHNSFDCCDSFTMNRGAIKGFFSTVTRPTKSRYEGSQTGEEDGLNERERRRDVQIAKDITGKWGRRWTRETIGNTSRGLRAWRSGKKKKTRERLHLPFTWTLLLQKKCCLTSCSTFCSSSVTEISRQTPLCSLLLLASKLSYEMNDYSLLCVLC